MPTPPDPSLDRLLDALLDVEDAETRAEAEALRDRVRGAAMEAWRAEPVGRLVPQVPGLVADRAVEDVADAAPRRRLSWTTGLRVAALVLVGLAIGLAFLPDPVTPPASAEVDLAFVAGRRWRRLDGPFERRGSTLFVASGTRIAWEPRGLLLGADGLVFEVDPEVEVVARVDGREVGRSTGGEILRLEDGWYGSKEGRELELELRRPGGVPGSWIGFRGVTFRWIPDGD